MIIAIKDKDRVVLGFVNTDRWDCISEKDYIDEENVAIKFSKTGKAFACAETNRRSDVLLYDETFLELDVTPKTIVKEIVPHIKCSLQENNISIDDNGNWGNCLIVCDNNTLYDVDPTFGFCEITDYICHGYNVDTLKSVLDATILLPAEERIIKAVKFISKIHKLNLFPFIITDTKDKQFKTITEEGVYNEYFNSI